MDIRLEPRTAAHPKREEIERLHETMKKRELGRKRRRLWSRFGVNLVVSVLVCFPPRYISSFRQNNFHLLLNKMQPISP